MKESPANHKIRKLYIGTQTRHAPDAKAVPAIEPVRRIQCAGVRTQVVSAGTTIRRSGPVEQVGSSVPVLI